MNMCKCGHHLFEHHDHYVKSLSGLVGCCMHPGCDCKGFHPDVIQREPKIFSISDRPTGFVVGDVVEGVPCSHPFLDAVGDGGQVITLSGQPVARYEVVKVSVNPETGESVTKDIRMVEVF